MDQAKTLENEISRLLHGVDRYKRVITRATSRVGIMEGDIELHREALEKLKQSLAKIDERARRQRASTPPSPETPPETPPEPPPARSFMK